MTYQYNSTAPLECCEFKELDRQIGVTVSDPFTHHGMHRQCVEVHRETVCVNTKTFGNPGVPANDWHATALKFTWDTIKDLERVIGELEAHKSRLEHQVAVLASQKKR